VDHLNEKDNGGFGLLIKGKKTLDEVRVPVYAIDPGTGMAYEVANYPMDAGVTKIYQSRAGGFVPPTAGGDTCFSQLHYGEGFFEGMRFYDSPNGVVLTRPWMNYARFLHSATVFNPKLAKVAREYFSTYDDLTKMHLGIPLTPKAYYEIAEENYHSGKNMEIPVNLENAGGKSGIVYVDMSMQVAGARGAIFDMTMKDMDTIIKVLAYTGRLVPTDYFPETLEMKLAGYIRPWGWISGEDGLKVPSIKMVNNNGVPTIKNKPLYVAFATLPWALYLGEKDYERGLDVLVSPYVRINDDTMPSNAKVAGNYVNSLMPINMGLMFGFGEILAFNRDKKFVEGSAENAFVFMEESGKIIAYTPPISAGCLPGTTRDGVIRSIENIGIEVRYQGLELRHLYDAKAVLLTGTGAQMIHVRSITELMAANKIADAVRLRSEGMEYVQNTIDRADFERVEKLINGGERHEVVARVQSEYKRMMVQEAGMIEPVHNIDFQTLGRLVGLDAADFMTRKDRANASGGYFSERINGISQPDELAKKHRAVARIIHAAMKKMPSPGISASMLMKGSR